jgi:hypothetical protein
MKQLSRIHANVQADKKEKKISWIQGTYQQMCPVFLLNYLFDWNVLLKKLMSIVEDKKL